MYRIYVYFVYIYGIYTILYIYHCIYLTLYSTIQHHDTEWTSNGTPFEEYRSLLRTPYLHRGTHCSLVTKKSYFFFGFDTLS